jgi:hypothetical protein
MIEPDGMLTDMRQVWRIVALVGALAAGFLVTLWVTRPAPDPTDRRPDSQRLADHRIGGVSDLIDVALALGMETAPQLQANVDAIARTDERNVKIEGWLADTEGDATPLELLVFVRGALAGRTRTEGERPDVTRTLGLAFGAEKNVAFRVSFACRTGDQPIVVGLGGDKRYLRVRSPPCP